MIETDLDAPTGSPFPLAGRAVAERLFHKAKTRPPDGIALRILSLLGMALEVFYGESASSGYGSIERYRI